jgi:hypothetical protein
MAGTTALEISRKYSSFSGCDIKIIIAGVAVGAAQAMSYAVQREKAPIYVLGKVSPLSFSRGKRGIAGTMVTLMLDRHFMYTEPFRNMKGVFDNDEYISNPSDANSVPDQGQGLADLTTVGGGQVFNAGSISSNFLVRPAWYVDQIPPFDAAIVAVNEYGNAASMRIYGIEILNEGSGFSVDDMVIENQMTYVAREVYPWQPLGYWNLGGGGEFVQTDNS